MRRCLSSLARLTSAIVSAAILHQGVTAPLAGQATTRTIAGTVTSSRTLQPLPGTGLTIEGTNLQYVTDNRGRFLFANAPAGPVTLIVTQIGYRQLSVTVDPGATMVAIEMRPDPIMLDGIVVTGTAGEATARSVGNAIGIVQAAPREILAPSPNVQRMISAQVPGVRILSSGGEVGTGGVARIRGVASLSLSGAPLIYVDGIRVNGEDGNGWNVGFDPRRGASRINDFNPEDIERIEVIKGPAASTLYGTEASNGVIQIFTKRGRQGAPRIELHMKQGVNYLPDPLSLFPTTFYQEGGLFSGGEIIPVNVLQNDLDRGFGSPFRTGHRQSYGGNISGGSDEIRYYMSAEYGRDEGPVEYNWQNKLSGRANLSYTPNETFSLDFSLGLVRSRAQSASAQQPLTTSIIWACPASSCEPGQGEDGGPSFPGLDGEMRGYLGYTPETYTEDTEAFEELDRTTFSVRASHNPTTWLRHQVTAGGDFGNTRTSGLWRANGSVTGSWYPNGLKEVANLRSTYVTLDYQATATLDATSDLGFSTTGGAQYYRRQQQGAYASGENFPVEALETVSSGALRTGEEDFRENKTFGLFVQEQMAWKNRVFLTGAVRGDDNSAFGRDFDFQVYPKLSGSWVISEEPFFDRVPLFDQLKLRTAWGKAGQQPELFAALQTYRPAVGRDGAATVTPDNLGNFGLEPEIGNEVEVGFDAGILDGRVGLEFTYYNQHRKNAIVRVPAPPSNGFPGFQFQNIGEVKNSGIEIGIDAQAFTSANLSVGFNFTYATAKNEIVSIGGQDPIVNSPVSFHVQGMPIGGIYTKTVVSADIIEVAPNFMAADPTSVMCEGGDILAGATKLSQGGGLPVPCESAPLVYQGQPIPTWEGSFSATITMFKNFQIFGLVDYAGGHTMNVGDVAAAHIFFLNSRAILERTDPILLGYEAIQEINAPGIMNAGWAKLRNLSLTYTVPPEFAQRMGVSRMLLTFAADNIATIWRAQESSFGHRWMDPEQVDQTGVTRGLNPYRQEGWPQTRRFTTSLRITM